MRNFFSTDSFDVIRINTCNLLPLKKWLISFLLICIWIKKGSLFTIGLRRIYFRFFILQRELPWRYANCSRHVLIFAMQLRAAHSALDIPIYFMITLNSDKTANWNFWNRTNIRFLLDSVKNVLTFQSISTPKSDWFLTTFLLHFDCILTEFWLHFDRILPAFDYILAAF